MRIISIKIMFCINLTGVCFAEESFFMTAEESEAVLSAMVGKNQDQAGAYKDLKLSGIFYMNEDDWTVWINDIAYSTIGQQRDFSIDEVSEESVCLTLSDGKTLQLSVSPGDATQEED